jgi:hypothetical protein
MPNREQCVICGMTANIDPSLHTERYGHVPAVFRDGEVWAFSFETYAFTTLAGNGNHLATGGRA